MIDYCKLLTELQEEKAACQYAYGEIIPAFYTLTLQKAIEAIAKCRDCAAEAQQMAREVYKWRNTR